MVSPSLVRKRLMHPCFSSTPFWSLMIPKVLPGFKEVAESKNPAAGVLSCSSEHPRAAATGGVLCRL